METKREMTIGKTTITVTDTMLKQSDLEFYPENPRVFTALHTLDDDSPTQEVIEKEMCRLDHVKTLKTSIEANGGLLEPIIVKKNTVLEGNSRLAAYRMLAKNDPVKWGMIRCTVLPDDISEELILNLLGTIHIIGRMDWNAFEKAGYLYRTKEKSRRPINAIADDLGMKVSDAVMYIKVYTRMREENDMLPRRWSYYFELLKNSAIVKADEENPEMDIISKTIEKIKNEEFSDAKDVRDIGKVIKSQNEDALMVLENYLDGEISLDDAVELTGDLNKAQTIIKGFAKFNKLLTDNWQSILSQTKVDTDLNMSINQLSDTLNTLQKLITRG
ncbi:MAG: ParB N-terminal domain-containing protein [Paludibacteraceae bacterium]|nr:ParB N-terminal domain-containing protein [Paludibacteraceae bacterium]